MGLNKYCKPIEVDYYFVLAFKAFDATKRPHTKHVVARSFTLLMLSQFERFSYSVAIPKSLNFVRPWCVGNVEH